MGCWVGRAPKGEPDAWMGCCCGRPPAAPLEGPSSAGGSTAGACGLAADEPIGGADAADSALGGETGELPESIPIGGCMGSTLGGSTGAPLKPIPAGGCPCAGVIACAGAGSLCTCALPVPGGWTEPKFEGLGGWTEPKFEGGATSGADAGVGANSAAATGAGGAGGEGLSKRSRVGGA